MEASTMIWKLNVVALLATFSLTIVLGDHHPTFGHFSTGSHRENMLKMQAFKASLIRGRGLADSSTSSGHLTQPHPPNWVRRSRDSPVRVYYVTDFGGDPTGQKDSTEQIQKLLFAAAGQELNEDEDAGEVLSGVAEGPSEGELTAGVPNKAGTADFQGGTYKISKPLEVPPGGNLVIKDGTIIANDNYTGGPAFNMSSQKPPSPPPSPKKPPAAAAAEEEEKMESPFMDELATSSSTSFAYEHVIFQNIMIDSNHRGGGIHIGNALRTSIQNVYIAHFNGTGIHVDTSSTETYITNSFLGQHPNAGRDPRERSFAGTAIDLSGINNALSNVVLFSSAVGVDVSGQGNTLSGVHCYNKATRFGGTGIYVRQSKGWGQNRITNSFMDYTGIVAEDPLQLHIANSFFRGNAFVSLKSVKGTVNGVNIVDNTFGGSNRGTGIVQLQQSKVPFGQINQVVVDRNSVKGMSNKATVASGSVQGNGTTFTIDFNPILLFPNRIRSVEYSLVASGGAFPNHVLRSVANNRVVVATNVPVTATVFATVSQN